MMLSDDEIIAKALEILESRVRKGLYSAASPTLVKQYLTVKLSGEEREVFGIIYLDIQHQIIHCEDLFYGTLTMATVYPREVVKRILQLNAASIIVFHNHPSGVSTESRADVALTEQLKRACEVIDVRLLDHLIVGGVEITSFAEKGIL